MGSGHIILCDNHGSYNYSVFLHIKKDKGKEMKVWIREFYLEKLVKAGTAYEIRKNPQPGYVPVTIIEGHDLDKREVKAGIIVDEAAKDQIIDYVDEQLRKANQVLPKFRWKIRHKLSGHELVTKNKYTSFNENIVEQWPGQTRTVYLNYEAIEPVND